MDVSCIHLSPTFCGASFHSSHEHLFIHNLQFTLVESKLEKGCLDNHFVFNAFCMVHNTILSSLPNPPQMLRREPLAKGTFEYISDNNNFKIITLTQDKFLYIKTVSESKTLTAIWYFFLASQLFIVSLPTLFIKKLEEKKSEFFHSSISCYSSPHSYLSAPSHLLEKST